MVAYLIAFTLLRWTNPTHEAMYQDSSGVWWAGGCEPGPTLERLSHTVLIITHQSGHRSRKDVDSLVVPATGLTDSAWVDDRDLPTIVYAISVDSAGGRSCPSNTIGLVPTVGVPPASASEPVVRYYDLQGRRVRPPLRSGVYFKRTRSTYKIVVVR